MVVVSHWALDFELSVDECLVADSHDPLRKRRLAQSAKRYMQTTNRLETEIKEDMRKNRVTVRKLTNERNPCCAETGS